MLVLVLDNGTSIQFPDGSWYEVHEPSLRGAGIWRGEIRVFDSYGQLVNIVVLGGWHMLEVTPDRAGPAAIQPRIRRRILPLNGEGRQEGSQ